MGQVMCRRCCPCCPCCPPNPEPPTTSPHLDITQPSEDKKPPRPTFQSFIKPHTNEEIDGDKRSIRTPKPSKGFIDLKKEDNMLGGQDNIGFEGTPDPDNDSGTEPQPPGIEIELIIPTYVTHPPHTQLDPVPRATTSGNRLSNLSRATKVSTYSYKPRSSQDLDIKKGQHVEIIEDRGEWVIARTLNGNGESTTGFIPTNFLANEGSLEAEDWYFGSMTKLDAKRYLLQEENRSGSYLMWKKEEDDCYYISVREEQNVRHYRVHQSRNGSFYLVERASFSSLKGLVQYYCQQCDGLCTKLENPCVKLDLPTVESISHTTIDQLEIDPSSIQRVRKLGSGRFGTVWLGLWNGTTEVAVKELQVTAESLHKTMHGEAETMWKLSHEKLLKLYAVCLQTNPVFIVTEYMPHGNLKKYLQAHQKEKDLPFPQMVDFAVQICQGMKYMEQKGCVHRDLRSENILLSAMMSCKIGDFGLARFMDSTSIAVTADAQIPIKWTAPEVFLMQKYTSKSDLWSFGVLLVEIVTYGKSPFPNKNNGQYRQDILNNKPLTPPPESPEDISDIMRMCWRYRPETRPSFFEIQQFLMDLLSPMLGDDAVE
ncbi:tyrosine-protein kinase SRK2-like [Hyla sarda]|uniref:tyrosine-protein kinase SRK2-like n=1 Tax=Hyla sarda TaxID=327740 RepID=UPI0024C327ED|nr:tyrosine-protein kinase SRK2-like [Hyla sarda]